MAKRKRRSSAAPILIPLALLVVVGVVAFFVLKPSPAKPPVIVPQVSCPAAPTVIVDALSIPAGPLAGFCQSQLVDAALVLGAAHSLAINRHGQEIGIMTAIGESSLRNVDFGDTAGPDSRGIFQQRSNYGSLAARMSPYSAARHFYFRMLGLPHWQTLAPTVVAHAVQGNANPNYYTAFWSRAKSLVGDLYSYQLLLPQRPLLP